MKDLGKVFEKVHMAETSRKPKLIEEGLDGMIEIFEYVTSDNYLPKIKEIFRGDEAKQGLLELGIDIGKALIQIKDEFLRIFKMVRIVYAHF